MLFIQQTWVLAMETIIARGAAVIVESVPSRGMLTIAGSPESEMRDVDRWKMSDLGAGGDVTFGRGGCVLPRRRTREQSIPLVSV